MADWAPKTAVPLNDNWTPKTAVPLDVPTAPPAPPISVTPSRTPVEPSLGTSIERGLEQGFTGNFGDEASGLVQATGLKYLPEWMGGGSPEEAAKPFGQLYRENRDVVRKENQQAEDAHKGAFLAGNVAGGLPSGIATGGGGLIRAAATGLGAGALSGLGGSSADLTQEGNKWRAAQDTTVGGILGAALPVGFKAAGKLFGAGAKALRAGNFRFVTPSPEAELLMDKGVTGMTVGQTAPKSLLGGVEEASQSSWAGGATLKSQREAGPKSWQHVFMDSARAPETPPLTPDAPISDKVKELLAGYDNAYADAIGQKKINLRFGAGRDINYAIADPDVMASDEVVNTVQKYVKNQLTVLKPSPSGSVPARAVQLVRSAIRSQSREMFQGNPTPDHTAAGKLLNNVADVLTDVLDKGLPPESASLLKATDTKYGDFLRVIDAVAAAGDKEGGFTPYMASNAVGKGLSKLEKAAGGGGELRDLARAGRAVFDTHVPVTGARLAGIVPGSAVGISALNASPEAQQFLFKLRSSPQIPLPSLPPQVGQVLQGVGASAGKTVARQSVAEDPYANRLFKK